MPTFTYLIIGKKRIYICDTHVGSGSMEDIQTFIREREEDKDKSIVVFNSHFHWDHVWGNCAFPDVLIVAHKECRELMNNDIIWEQSAGNKQYTFGDNTRVLPNLTFEDRITFEEDEITFFHSPGHSSDSASCYDKKDKVLFVGDNLESPFIYIDWHRLDIYQKTLTVYKDLEVDTLIASHDGVIEKELIDKTADYLSHFFDKDIQFDSEDAEMAHKSNMRAAIFSRHIEKLEKKLQDDFKLGELLEIMNDACAENMDAEEFEKALISYASKKEK